MRLLTVIILLAGSVAPASEIGFLTGQGARLVIGQETFTAQTPGTSATLLGGVGGVAYGNDTLIVADSNRLGALPQNNRVLIYRNISLKWPQPTDEVPQLKRCNVCVGEADVVLGQSTFEASDPQPAAADTLRLPLGVATDGVRVAVADTDHNRVLIWTSIPTSNGQPADLVLGQESFDTAKSTGFNPTASSLKGPQNVWLMSDGSVWVADTGNNRVLKWNNPTQNGQNADLVLGAADFTTFVQQDLTQQNPKADAKSLLTPVFVSSDGQRLFVADLGQNRVLIWNSLPTQNGQAADIVVGQVNMEDRRANNSQALCEPDSVDETTGDKTFPSRCAATMNFPRAVISDGHWFFIADGGNDRVLVYDGVPTENGAAADAVIGQVNEFVNNTSDSAFPNDIASAGVIRTPTSLAWDGTNLYVTDPFNRRVLAFTLTERRVANTGVRNAASFEVFAAGQINFGGTTAKDETVTAVVQDDREYTYTVKDGDTIPDVATGLAEAINRGEGDPELFATPNPGFGAVILTAKIAGEIGNKIKYSVKKSTGAQISVRTASSTLRGGEEASKIAPYSIVSIVGEKLSDTRMSADLNAEALPTELGGVQVYIDGIRAPIFFVSATQVNAQVPIQVSDAQSASAYVRTVHSDGTVVASNAIPVPLIPFNPGIFAGGGADPRPGVALHYSSSATGVVSVDGNATAGDTATVIVRGRRYTYTVTQEDADAGECPDGADSCREKLVAGQQRIMKGLIDLINQDPEVEASPSNQFARIRLKARAEGPVGNGIRYSVETNSGSTVILTAVTTKLCCANEAGAPVTVDNPALPGETISVWATGLGLVDPEEARQQQKTGVKYRGPEANTPTEFVSSLVGGRTANVLSCALEPGTFGLYRCDLQLNQGLPTNMLTGATIAQGFQVSNIVTIPVYNPEPDTAVGP